MNQLQILAPQWQTDRQTEGLITTQSELKRSKDSFQLKTLYRCSSWLYITAMLLWTQFVSFSLWSNNNVLSLKLFFTQIHIWLNCFVMKSMTWMFSLFFSYGNKWLHCTLTIGRCPTHSVSSRLVTELPVFPERVLLSLPDLGFLFGSVFSWSHENAVVVIISPGRSNIFDSHHCTKRVWELFCWTCSGVI